MNKSFIVWLLMVGASSAFAADKAADKVVASKPPMASVPAETEQAAAQEPVKSYKRKVKRLPRGDLRNCLELKDNAAIIKCAETWK